MRKVIVSMNMTLDGYMASVNGTLDWHFPFWNEEMSASLTAQLMRADTILLGRHSYEAMAAYWPQVIEDPMVSPADSCFARQINQCNKIVFSNTLQQAAWQPTNIISGDIGAQVLAMKQQPGKDMIVFGSRSIVQALMRHGLIDEYQLWMHPVILQEGVPLFKGLRYHTSLQLLQSKTFSSGVILLHYSARIKIIQNKRSAAS